MMGMTSIGRPSSEGNTWAGSYLRASYVSVSQVLCRGRRDQVRFHGPSDLFGLWTSLNYHVPLFNGST